MPFYINRCDNCDYEFESKQSMSEDALKTCPECHCDTLYRVPQVPYISIMNEPKTLEHLAYRNTKKFSEDYKESLDPQGYREAKEREKAKSEEPWWGTPPKKLYTATPEQRNKYIETGEI